MNLLAPLGSFRHCSLPERFKAARGWIVANTVAGAGIRVTSTNLAPYPEVSGYLIPSLLCWGERDLAMQYGRWLTSIQNADGSWSDPSGVAPYTFDTGQVLKGLLALLDDLPELEPAIRSGCRWLMTRIESDGRMTTPDMGSWVLPGGRLIPEAIHLYALEPLLQIGRKWGVHAYEEAAQKVLAYYLRDPALIRFETLSHFHAYIVEALLDLGCTGEAAQAMDQIAVYQRRDGAVPAYSNVRWVCTTGLLQYAVIWYRLGERERAERAFACACKMQNVSGGFCGSRGWGANYFQKQEISWAIKYFFDALSWKIQSGFNNDANDFPEKIPSSDGRYRFVAEEIKLSKATRILEVGCGKGRFLQRLLEESPGLRLTGLDFSERMLEKLPAGVQRLPGTLLHIPVPDRVFDCVFCVEALEHAVNITSALREMDRVLAPGGTMVIIDKNRDCLGKLRLADWEQWFVAEEIAAFLRDLGLDVQTVRNLSYGDNDGMDGLFLGWIARKSGAVP